MKYISIFLFALLALTATAQNIGVIPTPQQVKFEEGVCPWADTFLVDESAAHKLKRAQKKGHTLIYEEKVDSIPGAVNQAQAYQLAIGDNEIRIRYCSAQGKKYAYITLMQLRRHYDDVMPCMTITDWPALEYRGWMDDISRKPVTRRAFAIKQSDILSRYKYNYGSYYTEHTSYNPDYPDLAPAEERLPTQGVDSPPLMANLQCFGHFEETTKHPFYNELRDAADVINPATEKSYLFLRSQIANTLRSYPWLPLFNINCDETESLGSGYARDYVERQGADETYCKHINRVYGIVQEEYARLKNDTTLWFRNSIADSIELLMWGDIVAKNPTMLRQLPKEMNYIAWFYTAQPHYREQIEPFKRLREEQGNHFWVAPSVGHHGCLAPVRNYIENIAYLTRDGYQAGARGMMNTTWDDFGEPLFADSWHGMLWGAEMAWKPLTNTDPQLAAEELADRERQFNTNFNEQYPQILHTLDTRCKPGNKINYSRQIYAVTALQHHPAIGDWYNYPALHQSLFSFYPSNIDAAALERCDIADSLVAKLLPQTDSAALPYYYYYLHRLQTISLQSRLRINIYRALHGNDAEARMQTKTLADAYFHHLHALECEYLRLWDQENISYDRHEIIDRYEALGREALYLDRHIFINVALQHNSEMPLVSLRTLYDDREIYYTLDGSAPSTSAIHYEGPFQLEHSSTIKAISYNQYGEGVVTEQYLLSHKGMASTIMLNTPYSTYRALYSGGGDEALIDGQLGSNDTYADGHWQGYWGDSIDAIIDFGEVKRVNEISMRFMQNTFDWILAPKEICIYTSTDGKRWTLNTRQHFDMNPRETGMRLKSYHVKTESIEPQKIGQEAAVESRYLRVVVPNPGPLPQWHPAPGQPSYLFTDEIIIR